MRRRICQLAIGLFIAVMSYQAAAGTLDEVRRNGIVTCGVGQNLPGFSARDKSGKWTGLDIDTCRAVAAATLGDARKTKFVPLTAKERFPALQSGEVDLIARNTTWTLSRDTALKLNFAGVNYYDGQGFMVRRELGLNDASELAGAVICVTSGTTTALNLSDFFKAAGIEFREVKFDAAVDAAQAYDAGRCDAFTSDRSALAAFRVTFSKPDDHILLPDIISKEPLGPVVRHGDDQWLDIVKWSLFAMIQAEESGVTSRNVDEMKQSRFPDVRRLLGVAGQLGENLNLNNDWAYRIVKQVGNYGEVYERNVGPETQLRLPRGLNALWKDGGLLYPMPFR